MLQQPPLQHLSPHLSLSILLSPRAADGRPMDPNTFGPLPLNAPITLPLG